VIHKPAIFSGGTWKFPAPISCRCKALTRPIAAGLSALAGQGMKEITIAVASSLRIDPAVFMN
jgi:hypothetical protein